MVCGCVVGVVKCHLYNRSVISRVLWRGNDEGTFEGQETKSDQSAEEHDQQETSYLPKLSICKQNWQGFFAYHYHSFTNVALVTTFLINLSLLAFKVCTLAFLPPSLTTSSPPSHSTPSHILTHILYTSLTTSSPPSHSTPSHILTHTSLSTGS